MKNVLLIVAACALLFAFTLEAPAVSPRPAESDAVAVWYPGKLLIQRRRAAKARGGWYLGKYLGSAFRAGC